MILNQNQFFGFDSEKKPRSVPGCVYFAIDTRRIYIYDMGGIPRLSASGDDEDVYAIPLWKPNSSGILYFENDIVNYDGGLYKNLTGTNTDVTPLLDGINWVVQLPTGDNLENQILRRTNEPVGGVEYSDQCFIMSDDYLIVDAFPVIQEIQMKKNEILTYMNFTTCNEQAFGFNPEVKLVPPVGKTLIVDGVDSDAFYLQGSGTDDNGTNVTIKISGDGNIAYVIAAPTQKVVFIQASDNTEQAPQRVSTTQNVNVNTVERSHKMSITGGEEIEWEETGEYDVSVTLGIKNDIARIPKRAIFHLEQWDGAAWTKITNTGRQIFLQKKEENLVIINGSVRVTDITHKMRIRMNCNDLGMILVNRDANAATAAVPSVSLTVIKTSEYEKII